MAEPPSTPAGTGASGRRAGWLRWRRVGWLVLGTLVLIVSTVAAVRQPPHPDALRPVPGWLDAGFWRWPVERNAFMRLPLSGSTINALHVADDGATWLLTEAGEILYVAGDGLRWQRQWPAVLRSADRAAGRAVPGIAVAAAQTLPPPTAATGKGEVANPAAQQAPPLPGKWLPEPAPEAPPQTPAASSPIVAPPALPALRALHVLPDQRHGWAVGDAGTLLATDDGGRHWQRLDSPQIGTTPLRGVWFADAQYGWIVGDDGLRLRSHDGGRSWQPPAPTRALPPPTLHAVRFVDRQRGWAVGAQGTLLASTDGGASWQTLRTGTQETLSALDVAADGGTVRIVGLEGTLLQLAGSELRTSRPAAPASLALFDLRFAADGRRGWIAAGDGWLLLTDDGGARWRRQRIGEDNLSALGLTADGRQLRIGGQGGALQVRLDDGPFAAWTRAGERQVRRLVRLRDGRLFLPGPNGGALVSDTSGERWQTLATGSDRTLMDVCFAAGGRRGWMVGQSGTLLASVDGGRRWQPLDSGTGQDLLALDCSADGRRVLVLGRSGTSLLSTDGGATWQRQTLAGAPDLIAIRMKPDGLQGTATTTEGRVSTTIDGGMSWSAGSRGDDRALFHTVRAAAEGSRRWAIDLGGRLWDSADGGDDWQTRGDLPEGTPALYDVEAPGDGQRVYAVGADGTVVRSVDGGATWQKQDVASTRLLYGVRFAADGLHGWIAGAGPTLLATGDGGRSWRGGELNPDPALRDWPVYARYPAPWLYPAWAVGIGLLVLAGRKPPAEYAPAASIGDAPASDKPLAPGEADALAFGPLARGLANFLRNEHTRAPLTVAITGNWGTGKSSLMNLLRGALEAHGVRSVWFNAWHHQKEEHLLAALVDGIRRQAIPSFWSLDGLRFRRRLLAIRSGRHWLSALLVVGLVCWSGGYFLKDFPLRFERAWAFVQQVSADIADRDQPQAPEKGNARAGQPAGPGRPLAAPGPEASAVTAANAAAPPPATAAPSAAPAARTVTPLAAAALAQGLGALIAACAAFATILKAVRSFGVKPEALLASLADRTSMRDLGAQTSFRYRYQQEFAEVTRALAPRTMLILIDDLDRCQPAQVLEVLEAVNFLVSSGDCFIVLGIDKEKVQGALGLAFRELAQEMVDQAVVTGPDTRSDEERARARRQRYARDYLEKLINLEVPVPLLDAADPARSRGVLAGADAGHQQAGRRVRRWRRRLETGARVFAGLVLFAAAAAAGLYLAGITPEPPVPTMLTAPDAASAAASGGTNGASGPAAEGGAPAPAPAAQGAVAPLLPGQTATEPWLPLSAAIAVALACGVLAVALRRPDIVVRDSPRFGEALDVWHPYLLSHHRPTPRTLKRYQNRVRYVAMRQRPVAADTDPLDRLLHRLLRVPPAPAESEAALPEPLLVALGALQLVDPQALAAEAGTFTRAEMTAGAAAAGSPAPAGALTEAIARHRRQFGEASWPPSPGDVRRFLKLSEGVAIR